MTSNGVRQLRVVLIVDDFDHAVRYYRDTLGLAESAVLAGPDGARIVLLEAGRATLELADPAQARYIDAVEGAAVPSTPVRLAFELDDTVAAAEALGAAGARPIAPAVRTPWSSLNARLEGPAGVQVTLFQELAPAVAPGHGAAEVVGATLASLGDEPGVLARTVDLARQHGAIGQLPFATLVVRDGRVIGAGVNEALSDPDPSAHGEVTAIRDAARRTGSADLATAVIYSSCEPCAICRAVAASAGVSEIVFAAGKELVPAALDPAPQTTAQLIDAVTAVLPGIARRGSTMLSPAELSAPFAAYLQAVTR